MLKFFKLLQIIISINNSLLYGSLIFVYDIYKFISLNVCNEFLFYCQVNMQIVVVADPKQKGKEKLFKNFIKPRMMMISLIFLRFANVCSLFSARATQNHRHF